MTQNDAWKLPRPGDCCATCEQPFVAGELFTTVVRFLAEAPLREDLCTVCGKKAVTDPEVCYWTHRRPEQGQQRAVVDYAMLREIFGRLLLRPDDVYRRLSYLVALVLIRKRFLRLVGFQRRAGREVMVVTRGAGQPTLDVPAPLLTAEDLGLVRDQLAQLLNADLADHELPELAALRPEGTGHESPQAGDDAGMPASRAAPSSESVDAPDPAAVRPQGHAPTKGSVGSGSSSRKRSSGRNSPPG